MQNILRSLNETNPQRLNLWGFNLFTFYALLSLKALIIPLQKAELK